MSARLSDPSPALRAEDSVRADSPDAVTVAEAQRVLLPGARVLGGAAGLSRRVTWATSLRSRPPAFEPRGGGEFVLASQEALESLRQGDQSLTVSRILEGLSQAGAAALALPPPIAPEVAATADALSLPVIALPEGVVLHETERGIIGLVLDRHNELQARASQLYRQLANLSMEARGLESILGEAAGVVGRIIAFEDAQFRLRSVVTPPGTPGTPWAIAAGDAALSSAEERAYLAESLRTQPMSATTPAAILLSAAQWNTTRYVSPVVTRERLRGYVSICGPSESLTEFDQLAASRVAAICAIELAKDDAVLAAEQRVQGDLVDELLRPNVDLESAERRAVHAGLPATGAFGVIVFGSAGGPLDHALSGPALADRVIRHLQRGGYPALVRADGAELAVICSVVAGKAGGRGAAAENGVSGAAAVSEPALNGEPVRAQLAALGEQLLALVQRETGGAQASAGVSRLHDSLAGLHRAGREARDALRIGQRVYGAGRLISFGDLGLYQVLHALRDAPELRTFYEQTLGPLVEYDRRTGLDLVETLEAFFACHGNLSQTAKRLSMHRNSLLYRVNRIQEVGGIDLEDADVRLSLQVALKARRLLT